MSNFPIAYKLSWLPRLLRPSLGGDAHGFAPASGTLMTPPPTGTVRLAFVGDISAVANRTVPACDPELAALLRSADLVVGNCESPVVERPRSALGTWLGTRHAMTERFLADALAAVGISREKLVLSLANNHALDQGTAGFEETLAALKRLGVRVVGLADEPVAKVVLSAQAISDRGGGALTIGFAAFTQWRNVGAKKFTSRVSMADGPANWPSGAANGIGLLCAVPHWDWEFRHFPRAATRALARKLVGQGVGLIAGGHAHVVQPIERIDGTLVAYGLGDFLGTALPRQPWPERIGAIMTVEVSAEAATRGAIAAWRMHFFMRRRERGRERLVAIEAVEGRLREKAERRLAAIFGGAP
jgi:poly-gamma-glutamate synthesis protein (capsule biosynthesis protein)